MLLVLGQLEHALVEVEPRQLAVEVELGASRAGGVCDGGRLLLGACSLGSPHHLQDDPLPQTAFTNSQRLAQAARRAPPGRARRPGAAAPGSGRGRRASRAPRPVPRRAPRARASSSVGPELGSRQVQQRAGAAAHRHGVIDGRRLVRRRTRAATSSRTASSSESVGGSERRCRSASTDEPTGTDSACSDAARRRPHRDLGRPAADVDHGERAERPRPRGPRRWNASRASSSPPQDLERHARALQLDRRRRGRARSPPGESQPWPRRGSALRRARAPARPDRRRPRRSRRSSRAGSGRRRPGCARSA